MYSCNQAYGKRYSKPCNQHLRLPTIRELLFNPLIRCNSKWMKEGTISYAIIIKRYSTLGLISCPQEYKENPQT